MNKITYVERGEDQVVYLKEQDLHFSSIIALVQKLFDRGIKFVGFETPMIKMYFDAGKDLGLRAIGGKFKNR